MLHGELQQSAGGPSSAGFYLLGGWWGHHGVSGEWPGRWGWYGGEGLVSGKQLFIYWYKHVSIFLNMGLQQCEFAFLGEFILCLVLGWNSFLSDSMESSQTLQKVLLQAISSHKETASLNVTMATKWWNSDPNSSWSFVEPDSYLHCEREGTSEQ